MQKILWRWTQLGVPGVAIVLLLIFQQRYVQHQRNLDRAQSGSNSTAVIARTLQIDPAQIIETKTITGEYSGKVFTYVHYFDAQSNVQLAWFDDTQQRSSQASMMQQERAAYWERYGNFDQSLVSELALKQPNDLISVTLWLRDESINRQLVIDTINQHTSQPYQFIQGQTAPILSATISKVDLEHIQWQTSIDRIYAVHAFTQ